MRQCGDCQLCCKLLPVPPLGKGANEVCKFQKFHKGCTAYGKPAMPMDCSLWSCRWLVEDDTGDVPRPDRGHFVIDIMPDYITAQEGGGPPITVQVVQVWVDPGFPDAHRDPGLRAYLLRRAQEGVAAQIRFNNKDAMILFAPPMTDDGQWHEVTSGVAGPQHTFADIERELGLVSVEITEQERSRQHG